MLAIERIEPDAWERARTLRLRALEESPDVFWLTVEDEAATTPSQWRSRLSRVDGATFVGVRDGVDVGLAVGARHHEHLSDAGLYAMWVAPESRSSGVASALIQAVVGWARAAGYPRLRLDVGDTNEAAVRLYERMGFQPSGATAVLPAPRTHLTEHERVLELAPGGLVTT